MNNEGKNVVEGTRKIGGETVALLVRNSCNDYTLASRESWWDLLCLIIPLQMLFDFS